MGMILIPGFKGGQAISLFDPLSKQTFQSAKDLEIFDDTNLLRPHKIKLEAVTLPTVSGGSDLKVFNSFLASDDKHYFIGTATIAGLNNIVLWNTGTGALSASPSYTTAYNTNTATAGTPLEEYKNGLFFSWGTNLDRWGDLSGSPSRSNISSGLDSAATYIMHHPGLGKLYFVHGKKIGIYDNSTVTLAGLTVDNGETIVGIEPLGRFVIVGVKGSGSKRSRFLIWDGVNTTVDDIIELGEIGLQGFKVVGNEIRYITQSYSTLGGSKIRLSVVTIGGQPKLIEERPYSVTSGSGSINANALSSIGDLFLYGFAGETYDINLGIFAYGSGSSKSNKLASLYRLISTGATTGVSIQSIKHNGSNLVVIWSTTNGGGTFHIDAFLTSTTPSTGSYDSNAFPLNNGKMDKIKRILIFHKNNPTSCGFTLKVKHFGHYPVGGSVLAADSFAALTTPQGSGSSTGKTQSTNDANYTIIENVDQFKEARFAELQIDWDEVTGLNATEIMFPIFVETVSGGDTIKVI